MSILAKIKDIPGAIFDAFRGRCTLFAIGFAVCGIWLALRGQLTHEYIEMVAAIQTLLLAHSVKEDHFGSGGAPPASGAAA